VLNFQCHQPNRTTIARTLNLGLLLGHPIHTYIYTHMYIICILMSSYRVSSFDRRHMSLGKESHQPANFD